jgi:CheY-like chemotaxis protein
MKILLAEDHEDTAMVYKLALQDKGHIVVHAKSGEDCLKVYHNEFQLATLRSDSKGRIEPFDAVILDYKMPMMNGLEVAKEIFAVNPHQRIIFASAYLQDMLLESIHRLNKVVEILNKPFSEQELIDTVEDKSIYSELQELDINIDVIKNANFRHEQLRYILDILKRGKKERDDKNHKSLR